MIVQLTIKPADRLAIERQFGQLGKRARTLAKRVLDRAINHARSLVATELAANIGVARKHLTTPHRFGAIGGESTGIAVRAIRANVQNLEAALWVSGARIPAIFLRAKSRATFNQGGRATGLVRVPNRVVRIKPGRFITVKRGAKGGASWNSQGGRTQGSNVFRVKMKSGHVGLYTRSGGPRSKLWEVTGVSVPYASVKNNRVRRIFDKDIGPFIRKRLAQELARTDARAIRA